MGPSAFHQVIAVRIINDAPAGELVTSTYPVPGLLLRCGGVGFRAHVRGRFLRGMLAIVEPQGPPVGGQGSRDGGGQQLEGCA